MNTQNFTKATQEKPKEIPKHKLMDMLLQGVIAYKVKPDDVLNLETTGILSPAAINYLQKYHLQNVLDYANEILSKLK